MKDKDSHLIWESFARPVVEQPVSQFKFTSKRPLTSNYMYLQAGDVGIEMEDINGMYYNVEVEIGWEGSHYKGAGPGSYWGPEPDEEPMVDGVNVVYVRNEDDKEVDEATYKAIDRWVYGQLNGLGWSDMEAMGWDPPQDDGDY
jgi:hypothetical protein